MRNPKAMRLIHFANPSSTNLQIQDKSYHPQSAQLVDITWKLFSFQPSTFQALGTIWNPRGSLNMEHGTAALVGSLAFFSFRYWILEFWIGIQGFLFKYFLYCLIYLRYLFPIGLESGPSLTLSVSHSPISWWCWDVINVTLADEDASKKIIYVEVGVEDGFGNCSMTAGKLITAWQHFQSSVTDWTFSGHSLKLVFYRFCIFANSLHKSTKFVGPLSLWQHMY